MENLILIQVNSGSYITINTANNVLSNDQQLLELINNSMASQFILFAENLKVWEFKQDTLYVCNQNNDIYKIHSDDGELYYKSPNYGWTKAMISFNDIANLTFVERAESNWAKVPIDTKILLVDGKKRYFAGYEAAEDIVHFYMDGRTSWNAYGKDCAFADDCSIVEERG